MSIYEEKCPNGIGGVIKFKIKGERVPTPTYPCICRSRLIEILQDQLREGMILVQGVWRNPSEMPYSHRSTITKID